MRSVDVDCNRDVSRAGRAHTRLVHRKERKEHTAGRCQSKTWSQKDEKSFVSPFLDPIFLTQDFFPPPLRASSCNSCKAPFAFSAFFAVINFAFSGSSHLPINSFYP